MNKSGNDRQVYKKNKIMHVCYKGNLYAPVQEPSTSDPKYTSKSHQQSLSQFQTASAESAFTFNGRVTITPVLNAEQQWDEKYYIKVKDTYHTETWAIATDVINAPKVVVTQEVTDITPMISVSHATNELLNKITSIDDIIVNEKKVVSI